MAKDTPLIDTPLIDKKAQKTDYGTFSAQMPFFKTMGYKKQLQDLSAEIKNLMAERDKFNASIGPKKP